MGYSTANAFRRRLLGGLELGRSDRESDQSHLAPLLHRSLVLEPQKKSHPRGGSPEADNALYQNSVVPAQFAPTGFVAHVTGGPALVQPAAGVAGALKEPWAGLPSSILRSISARMSEGT